MFVEITIAICLNDLKIHVLGINKFTESTLLKKQRKLCMVLSKIYIQFSVMMLRTNGMYSYVVFS